MLQSGSKVREWAEELHLLPGAQRTIDQEQKAGEGSDEDQKSWVVGPGSDPLILMC